MSFARVALAALLTLGPTVAAAQAQQLPNLRTPPDEPGRTAPRAPGGGLEVGALASVALIVPAFGGQVSVPVTRRVSFEASGELAPWVLNDGDDFWVATQLQIRVPFRERPRARRSLVVGVTNLTVMDRWSTPAGRSAWEWETFLTPHAGLSWQWQRSAHVDMRLDVQGLVVGYAPFVVPRVAFSTVWRKQGGRL